MLASAPHIILNFLLHLTCTLGTDTAPFGPKALGAAQINIALQHCCTLVCAQCVYVYPRDLSSFFHFCFLLVYSCRN